MFYKFFWVKNGLEKRFKIIKKKLKPWFFFYKKNETNQLQIKKKIKGLIAQAC
jgi:hypothetical protein